MYNLYFLACLLWDLSSFVSLISDDEDTDSRSAADSTV